MQTNVFLLFFGGSWEAVTMTMPAHKPTSINNKPPSYCNTGATVQLSFPEPQKVLTEDDWLVDGWLIKWFRLLMHLLPMSAVLSAWQRNLSPAADKHARCRCLAHIISDFLVTFDEAW